MALALEVKKRLGNNEKLINTLEEIKDAVSAIWFGDRIIKDYTDHGISHNERVIKYILDIKDKILLNKVTFTKEEYFILFASAYLHDIGMQCDLSKHEDIKDKLLENSITKDFNIVKKRDKNGNLIEEKLTFNNNASNYTDNEQNALRKVHNWAAIYWIDKASAREKCVNEKLKTAIRKISEYNKSLIEDIKQVCLYHAKLNIKEIKNRFEYSDDGGRTLLAAVFRLADELDTEQKRVENVDTLLNIFKYNEESAFYWWAHSKQQINIVNQVIYFKFYIHPDDEKFKDIIKNKYEEEFKEKNQEIIDILEIACGRGSRIEINIEVKVRDSEQKIPEKIKERLKKK